MSEEKPKERSFFKSKRGIIMIIIAVALILLFLITNEYKTELEGIENADDAKNISLFFASVVIGLLDGFNPCAMWVLIYLIGVVASLNDRRKMWYIVGTFLFASGIIYFIILSMWLAGWEMISLLSFYNFIIYGVGAFALWMGIKSIHDFIKSGGNITCKVGDLQSRRKTMDKIKNVIEKPLTIYSFFGLIALAFAINSIEFVCSAGLPAIYTQLLTLSPITLAMKTFYMLIYVLAFMADDILIFTLALMAIDSPIMDKYAGLAKLIGGIVMALIGIMLLFFPGVLM
jgi:hypothetical protein